MRLSKVAFDAGAGVLASAGTRSHRGAVVEESCKGVSKGQSGDVECVCASAHEYELACTVDVRVHCAALRAAHCVHDTVDGRYRRTRYPKKEVVIFMSHLVIFFISISYLITCGHTR